MDFNQMPLGFGMALARNFNALNTFSAMDEKQKQAVLENVRSAGSERERNEIINALGANRLR